MKLPNGRQLFFVKGRKMFFKIKGKALAAAFALGIGIVGNVEDASAACRSGLVGTVDGKCMPRGAVDCGHGRGYCPSGMLCRPRAGCETSQGRADRLKSDREAAERTRAAQQAQQDAQRVQREAQRAQQAATRTPPPSQTTQQSQARCSTITSRDNPGSARCPTQPRGLMCGNVSCNLPTVYTRAKPYNQSTSAIRFQPFRGATITIPPGHTLWSVEDRSSPTGRRLEARRWDNTALTGSRCASEYGTARTQGTFKVDIECETIRQEKQQTEFEDREDGYLDPTQCRGEVVPTPGWETRSAEYWKANPTIPVGYCHVIDRQNPVARVDRRPVRQKDWYSPSECETLSSIQRMSKVELNIRGVRGCKAL